MSSVSWLVTGSVVCRGSGVFGCAGGWLVLTGFVVLYFLAGFPEF
jgi:hypothetical protein